MEFNLDQAIKDKEEAEKLEVKRLCDDSRIEEAVNKKKDEIKGKIKEGYIRELISLKEQLKAIQNDLSLASSGIIEYQELFDFLMQATEDLTQEHKIVNQRLKEALAAQAVAEAAQEKAEAERDQAREAQKQALAELAAALAEAKKEAEADLKQLQHQLATAQQEAEEAKAAAEESKKELARVQAELQAAQKEVEDKEAELAEAREAKQQVESKLETAKAQADQKIALVSAELADVKLILAAEEKLLQENLNAAQAAEIAMQEADEEIKVCYDKLASDIKMFETLLYNKEGVEKIISKIA